jgi:RNA polymerase sigma-70 factor (ECF subfamily)
VYATIVIKWSGTPAALAASKMSVEETARCLSIPASTVRTRLFRARALLRASLSRDVDMATGSVFAFAGARCDRIVATVLARVA